MMRAADEHLTLECAVARLEDWTERMAAAEASGDRAQRAIAEQLVHAYTFLVADMRRELH